MLLIVKFLVVFITVASADKPLPTYELDHGAPPEWMNPGDAANAAMHRWYIDKVTAKCILFLYLGSLGNFNNFHNEETCNDHLVHKPEEQLAACQDSEDPGMCEPATTDDYEDRWRFDRDTNDCVIFRYSKCGGNANNFLSRDECLDACQNNRYGGIVEVQGQYREYPNAFDCKFRPDVDTEDPDMGIVPHDTLPQCVYAAIKKGAFRGFFKDLPSCAHYCLSMWFIKSDLFTSVRTQTGARPFIQNNLMETYFAYRPTTKLCMPYESKGIDDVRLDSGQINAFTSPELCASFCPAINQIGPLKAVEACTLPAEGVCVSDPRQICQYSLPRFYYAPEETDSNTGQKGVCKEFNFNGVDLNLNNFRTKAECEAICKTPLLSGG